MPSGQLILQALMTIGVGGALAPFIAALFNRGKTRSESGHLDATATQVISAAAAEVALTYQKLGVDAAKQIQETRDELHATRNELGDVRRNGERMREEIADLHRKLDIAIEKLTAMGEDVSRITY